jgi:hypothetical protein
VPDGRATSKQVRDGSQSAIPTASVQETSTGCPKRRNTLTERVPIRPTQDMGRIATGGSRRRWHIVDDWLGAPICGRVPESEIVDGRLYDDVRGGRICQHCHHELSWRPSPAEYVHEDRGYDTPCLIWRRSLDAYGYGKRGRGRRWTFAHRDAYEVARRPCTAAPRREALRWGPTCLTAPIAYQIGSSTRGIAWSGGSICASTDTPIVLMKSAAGRRHQLRKEAERG